MSLRHLLCHILWFNGRNKYTIGTYTLLPYSLEVLVIKDYNHLNQHIELETQFGDNENVKTKQRQVNSELLT